MGNLRTLVCFFITTKIPNKAIFHDYDPCHRAHRECNKLRGTFLYLDYPINQKFMYVTDNIDAPMPRLQVTTNYKGSTTIEVQPSFSQKANAEFE